MLYELVFPWGHSDRTVVADSYFASVPAAVRLFVNGLRFIGVLKTSTREYPMPYLSNVELPAGKGDRRGLYTVDQASGCRMLAFVWADRDRRYFITTCSNIQEGAMIDRHRWRQVDQAPNADASRVNVTIRQPRAAEIYYSACAGIDRHNRCRQAGLMIEKKVRVHTFDRRVNTTIFGMACVDAQKLFLGIRKPLSIPERDFYSRLAEQLIDNQYDNRNLRARSKRSTDAELLLQELDSNSSHNSIPSNQQLLGVTPTKRHKANHPKHLLQGRCKSCDALATTVCRECQQELGTLAREQVWICNKPGKVCMGKHIAAHHPDMVALPGSAKRAIHYNRVI